VRARTEEEEGEGDLEEDLPQAGGGGRRRICPGRRRAIEDGSNLDVPIQN
jgi:hypothetical protein